MQLYAAAAAPSGAASTLRRVPVVVVCAWCGVTQPPSPSDEELARIHERWAGPDEHELVTHTICKSCAAELLKPAA